MASLPTATNNTWYAFNPVAAFTMVPTLSGSLESFHFLWFPPLFPSIPLKVLFLVAPKLELRIPYIKLQRRPHQMSASGGFVQCRVKWSPGPYTCSLIRRTFWSFVASCGPLQALHAPSREFPLPQNSGCCATVAVIKHPAQLDL